MDSSGILRFGMSRYESFQCCEHYPEFTHFIHTDFKVVRREMTRIVDTRLHTAHQKAFFQNTFQKSQTLKCERDDELSDLIPALHKGHERN
jgi:hypothetical protein